MSLDPTLTIGIRLEMVLVCKGYQEFATKPLIDFPFASTVRLVGAFFELDGEMRGCVGAVLAEDFDVIINALPEMSIG